MYLNPSPTPGCDKRLKFLGDFKKDFEDWLCVFCFCFNIKELDIFLNDWSLIVDQFHLFDAV